MIKMCGNKEVVCENKKIFPVDFAVGFYSSYPKEWKSESNALCFVC